MISLSLYIEGGGQTRAEQAQLRAGMSRFFSGIVEKARSRRIRWNIVMCGGRNETVKNFCNARKYQEEDEIVILLVDSEEQITAGSHIQHLRERQGDGHWELDGVSEDHVHLMAQTMESWIVADPDALADYYSQNFKKNLLPARQDLEEEPKEDCLDKLEKATDQTRKGKYHKGKHAPALLAKISSGKVRSRCRRAEILFSTLADMIEKNSIAP